MEKVINSYEVMFIVDLEGGEAAVKETVDKFTGLISANGELVEVSEWGKRRMAYPINDKPEGYYVVATFKSVPEFTVELDRIFNIDETVMRSMIIKLEFEAVKHEAAAETEAAEPADMEAREMSLLEEEQAADVAADAENAEKPIKVMKRKKK